MSDFKQEIASFKAAIPKKWQEAAWPPGELLVAQARSARPDLTNKDLAAKVNDTKMDAAKTEPVARETTQANPDQDKADGATAKKPGELKQAGLTPPKSVNLPVSVELAGGLTVVQRKAAHQQVETKPELTVDKMTTQLYLGGSAGVNTRQRQGRLDETTAGSNDSKSSDILLDYMAQQQRQEFMKSMEFSIALQTADQHINKLEVRANKLRTQVAEIQAERDELAAQVVQDQQQIDQKEDRISGLEEVVVARDEHKENLKKEDEMWAKNDALMQETYAPQRNTVKIIGKDTYVTVTEDGKPTLYKVGEDGQKVKVEEKDRPLFDPFQDTYYSRKTPDGNTEYVNGYGRAISQQEKDKIDNALKVTGTKPEDALADRDEMIRRQDAAIEQAAKDGVGDSAMWAQGKITDSSKARMDAAADKMGIAADRMDHLEEIIQDERTEFNQMREDLKKKIESLAGKDKELQAAKDELAIVEADMAEAHKFRTRLEKGEFKNEKEMVDAMPPSLKAEYEDKKKRELAATVKSPSNNVQAAAPQTSAQDTAKAADAPAADNTSRVNGSAAAPAVAASTTLGPPFGAAASGTQTTNPATPAAPQDDLVIANRAAKAPGAGAPAL